MIFATKDAIPKILSGEKTQTRRLAKEGEFEASRGFNVLMNGDHSTQYVFTKDNKKKWQVGKSYAVCPGRGKGTVGKCASCGALSYWVKNKGKQFPQQVFLTAKKCSLLCSWNPLRIRIKAIRKEKLLDITEADARKESFESRAQFLARFYEINQSSMPLNLKRKSHLWIVGEWNPDVWVLDFCVVKE